MDLIFILDLENINPSWSYAMLEATGALGEEREREMLCFRPGSPKL